jgi:tetratricopeptide (TPR) repeat protein
LVSWSGLFQRPFRYCMNHNEVRQLLDFIESAGPSLTELDNILYSMAKADALSNEDGFISVIEKLEQVSTSAAIKVLLMSYCANGLARITNTGPPADIDTLNSLDISTVTQLGIWHRPSVFENMRSHLISTSRQLTSEGLLCSQPQKALVLLEEAVADFPVDPDAGLAYGACLLRLTLQREDYSQQAKVQLIKTAKLMDPMDPRQARVFALLGLQFEYNGDTQRALGCFKKALSNDVCDPVAGRGILRLLSLDSLSDILDAAVSVNSSFNGWAWHAIGLQEAANGHDDRAAMAILKALRCQDVAKPDQGMEIFYKPPLTEPIASEKSSCLAEVGECYWHLGRFTASLRAFHAAIVAAGNLVLPRTLISCAQIELELGLVDDAAERFAMVLEMGESSVVPVASYWNAITLFQIAKRDLEEGKATSALRKTRLAIDSCESSNTEFCCTWKLLGDLYSFGAFMPPFLFIDENEEHKSLAKTCLLSQLDFVKNGEQAFQSCLDSLDDALMGLQEDSTVLRSAILCDLACNFIYQAQIASFLETEDGVGDTSELIDRAAATFQDAIQHNPLDAYSWCGLGCAVVKKDPLLAQHAFCQSSFLDKANPDPYGNLGFLYTSHGAFNTSRSTMEVLTEIADTPMMWINRAFILEEEAQNNLLTKKEAAATETRLSEAADAYRAALQVMNHPEAVMGLALTGRISHSSGNLTSLEMTSMCRKEYSSLIQEYTNALFGARRDAMVLGGVAMMEKAIEVGGSKWSEAAFEEAKSRLATNPLSTAKQDSFLDGSALPAVIEPVIETGDDTKGAEEPYSVLERCSLQRKILVDPHRAELWISLAKEYMARKKIPSAAEAASRASFILDQQLKSLRTTANGKHQIDCFLVSQAISLEQWLTGILVDDSNDEAKQQSKGKQEERNSDASTTSSSYALQRALMLNPSNLIARKGLETLVAGGNY